MTRLVTSLSHRWRYGLLLAFTAGTILVVLALEPIPQAAGYHNFADQRAFFGIPNAIDVLSNISFLCIGLRGLWLCAKRRLTGSISCWSVFFAGITLVSFGSGYYHWAPANGPLVWDRWPITISFMALFSALLSESINDKLGPYILVPALMIGTASVLYWHCYNDLRFYAWVQFFPLLSVPLVMALFRPRYSHQGYLVIALICYLLAKVFEVYDLKVLDLLGGMLAGHVFKHLMAAAGCFLVLEMVRKRQLVPARPN